MDQSGVFQTVSNLTKGLGHPLRWLIVEEIIVQGGKVQGSIVSINGVPQSTVIQHLRDMKKAGIIEGRIFGASSNYWIVPERLEYLISKLQEVMSKLEN